MKHSNSLLEAIDALRLEGFDIDFNVKDDQVSCPDSKIKFPIHAVEARYTIKIEEDSDADYTSYLFGIITPDGKKGILIDGEGSYSDSDFAFAKGKRKA